MARKKTSNESETADPAFEEALAEIEEIVEAMEHEQLPLEELVSRFERGSKLLAHCEKILHSARERIELITVGNTTETATGGSDDSIDPADEADADTDDDIRLF
ncbi:MAG: exodeoxyribonuclease VII small subunit [Verrucomicrobiae bacterium]|nr:exodeoxyribonuclease VII small subunit [Verrucomicrobiae bacterium]